MRLSIFQIPHKTTFYNANVRDDSEILLDEYFTAKCEAIKEVQNFRKKYKGEKQIDCFVRVFDADGFAIKDIGI